MGGESRRGVAKAGEGRRGKGRRGGSEGEARGGEARRSPSPSRAWHSCTKSPARQPAPELRYLYEHHAAKSTFQSWSCRGTLPTACAKSRPNGIGGFLAALAAVLSATMWAAIAGMSSTCQPRHTPRRLAGREPVRHPAGDRSVHRPSIGRLSLLLLLSPTWPVR